MRVTQKLTEIGGKITSILLRENDEQTAMELALKELGRSISVSRVYLFENIVMPNGEVITSQKYEWCAEGIVPKFHTPDSQNFSLKQILPDVYQFLSLGQNINAIVSDLSAEFKAVLEAQDIVSLLLVPILVDDLFWGAIGFDDCVNKELWSDSEVDLLCLSANSIGLYMKIKNEEKEKTNKLKELEFIKDNMNLGIWNRNVQTGEVVFSASLAAMLGYTMVEWGAGPEAWSSRVHPDDWNTITPAINDHIDGKTDYYESEHRLLCKDGSYKWVLDRGKVLEWDEKGHALRMFGTYTDIHFIKDYQKKIEIQQKNIQVFFDNNPIPLLLVDMETASIIKVSNSACSQYGYKKNDFLLLSYFDLVPDDEKVRLVAQFEKDGVLSQECRCNTHITRDGGTFHVDLYFKTMIYEDKSALLILCQDVTDKRVALESLAESEIRYQTLVSSLTEGIILRNADGRITACNKSAVDILGIPEEQLIGKNLSDVSLFMMESQQFIVENELHSSGSVKDFELTLKTKQGAVKHVILRLETIKQANADLIMLVFTDITEFKTLLSQLQEAHAQLENFFRAFDDMVFVFDMEKKHFTYVNSGAEKIFGRRIPINRDVSFLSKFLSPEDYHHLSDNLASIINGNILKGELKLQLPDGTVKWLLYKLWSRLGDGKRILEGICSDVTATKQIVESTQRALVKEKELNELKSIFISTASHEFRTPLATILSSVDIMESYDTNLTPQKKAQHYTKIKKSVKQMTSMLNEILTQSKKELSQIQVRKEKVNLIRLINQICEDIEASNQSNGVQIELVNKTGEESFSLDPKLMKSMLINLLLNAVKYSNSGTSVLVTIFKSKQDLVIEICDKGIGISQHDLQNIFKPFFRGKNVGDRPGTGLGMAIIKEGIDALNGTIHIASHIGAGTTVTLKIPVQTNSIV